MKNRKSICLTLVVGTGLLAATVVSAQEDGYRAPRAFGETPDLQGTWTNNTITPLTRPADFQSLIISAEDARRLEIAVAEVNEQQDQPSDPERDAPTKGRIDLQDSYNNFWFDDGTRVARYNGEYRSSLIVDPADGQVPAYTEQAQQRMAMAREARSKVGQFDGPELRPLAERCLLSFGSSSGPPMLPILYNNHYQIVQSPGYVMILVEMVHDARIIRINDDPLPDVMHPWLGDSVGHWEGDTLVVETGNINPNQRYRNSSDEFRVTERFTRAADDRINYSFTIHDPATFVHDWSAEIPMLLTEERLYEYACHEGNYALSGVLAGARLEEIRALGTR